MYVCVGVANILTKPLVRIFVTPSVTNILIKAPSVANILIKALVRIVVTLVSRFVYVYILFPEPGFVHRA